MKKILLATIAIAGLLIAGNAQQTKPSVTAIIKTPDALCENCKKRIEAYVKPYDGIVEINVNYRKGETKVKYIIDRINIEEIKAYIANCGYDADDVPAAEFAYNRLPGTCKKQKDGGHPGVKPPPPPPPQTPQQQ
ncbi:MAG: heavy-metal-associated domain-containing protein [Sphingobacteriales bacterium]|nr:heavy-metal-associated domain-containing protein [Sphingobacteriales bacterium]